MLLAYDRKQGLDQGSWSPVAKTAREEDELTELELDALKAENKSVASDNRPLKVERVSAVTFTLQRVSSDSQNLLDQYIKQNAEPSYLMERAKAKARGEISVQLWR